MDDLLDWLTERLYGPLTVVNLSNATIGPVVVSITAVEEVLVMMHRSAEDRVAQILLNQGVAMKVTRMTSIRDSSWDGHDMSRLTDPDWDWVNFDVRIEGDGGEYWEGLVISRSGGLISSRRQAPPLDREDSPARVRDLAEALTRGGRRLVPRVAKARIFGGLFSIGLLGLWLWTMFEVQPPLSAWLLSGLLVLGACWIFAERVRRLMLPGGVDQAPRGVFVDRTPRREVEANRLNRRLNWRVGLITSLIAGPLGIVAGAIVTKAIGT